MTPHDFDEILGFTQDDMTETKINMLQQHDFWLRVTLNCSAISFCSWLFRRVFCKL